jgi:hypothetical protein
LNRDRTFDGVHCARELDQRAVPDQLDHAAAVLGDQRLDEFFGHAFRRAIVPASSAPTSRL